MTGRLDGQVALVTGAGSGIGQAVALRLAAEGAALAVNDIDPARADATAVRIVAAGGRAAGIAGDVADEAAVAAMFARCREIFGDCSLLVNNAGFAHQSPFEHLSAADWDRMIAVHLRGTFLCCRAAIGPMLAKGEGTIVNIASQLGQIGGIELCHYSAAKAGIIGLTKSLAREVSRRGIRVNAVAPGPIDTPLIATLSDEWRAAKAAELPQGRFGAPEEVAATVAFLASNEASLFVGQTLGPNSGDVML